ncbi:MAG TPA: hypothetical protein VIH85_20020 [Solirubrobacteraceae bacterium]|jgi:hypothetical protein
MLRRWLEWTWALLVMVLTAALVVLDVTDDTVRNYLYRHSFTSSVLSGVLVLLLTVLIVDRVTRMRQVRNQSRAMAAQAAIIVAQATRTVDAITAASPSDEDRDAASEQLRTYTMMLLTSAPLLIEADDPRAFLETAQRLAAQLFRVLRNDGDASASKRRLDESVTQMRAAAAPLLQALTPPERTAVSSNGADGKAS